MRHFFLPTVISVLLLIAVYLFLGIWAAITALLLVVLEVTLSFDNAVVNARILENMSPLWQKRFLTWGMLIAVFGTRVVLPILIVSASVWISPIVIAQLALFSPEEYAHHLESAHYVISSFGAVFLLMVSLKYFFNEAKEVHWMSKVEEFLSRWGRIEAIEIGISLLVLSTIAFFSHQHQAEILSSGIIGIILFIVMQGISTSFAEGVTNTATTAGFTLFLYLNVLDSAFSLDSVVGAFALTTSIAIIAIGLGIGAYFVRSLTLYFVEQKTLHAMIYLEHGAHWAILALALSMFSSLLFEVPEIITGGIGILFVATAYWSSVKLKKI